jgi:Flp pilus assembly protein TadG
MPRLKNRRGVTLVLMAFMFTMLIGAAAVAIDFGRMRMYRTQLSTASDAAALAAVWHVLYKSTPLHDSAVTAAQYYALQHRVGPDADTLNDGDVTPGVWTLQNTCPSRTAADCFAASADWTDPNINAVRVVSRTRSPATQNYIFGQLFGINSHTVRDTAVAVMGYVGVTTCVRPIALPYQMLLNQIYGTDASGNPNQTFLSHPNLTDADVQALQAAGPAMAVQLKLGNDATQGNFYILQMGPYAHSDGIPLSPSPNFGGNNIFTDRFGGDCANSPWAIGPGDWLEGKTGDANGPTESGYQELCNTTINSNGFYPCSPPDSIKIAVWGNENDAMCTPRCFQTLFVGIFVVTGYTKSPGTAPDGVWGYFAAMPSEGSLTNVPTPIKKLQLIY